MENANLLDLAFGGIGLIILVGAILMMFTDFWTRKPK